MGLKITALFFVSILSACQADFGVVMNIQMFSNPGNTLANGTCCSDCSTECELTTLKFCFRPSMNNHGDFGSCFFNFNRGNPTNFNFISRAISGVYPGSFQIYVRVSYAPGGTVPDFEPPFTDALITNMFAEVEGISPVQFEQRNQATVKEFNLMGEFGQDISLRLLISVFCAENFNGSDCSSFCTDTLCTSITDLPSTSPAVFTETEPPTVIPSTGELTSSPTAIPSTGPTGSVVEAEERSFVPIIVGVVVGGGAGLLILVLTVVAVGCAVYRRKHRSWTPKRGNVPVSSPLDLRKPVSSSESDSSGSNSIALYATVNKPKRPETEEEVPPPIPAYNGDMDEYENVKGVESLVFENSTALTKQQEATRQEADNQASEWSDEDEPKYATVDL